MRSHDFWLYRAKSGSPRSPQICSDWYEDWYDEALVAADALQSAHARRLLTVPGVNVICAQTFLAAVGDIRRFQTSRELVGYLGLDPRVYQSGETPARGGRISKQGSPQARWALVEAAWSVVQQPGPLHAFYERIRARRGAKIAVVACARKLAVLFWCAAGIAELARQTSRPGQPGRSYG